MSATVDADDGLEAGQSVLIEVPAGAANQPTTLNFGTFAQPLVSPPQFALGNFVFDISAIQGSRASRFVGLQCAGNADDYLSRRRHYRRLNEATLTLSFFNEDRQSWDDTGITVISRDPVNNRIVVTIAHLTTFGLFDPSDRATLPLILDNPLVK